MGGVSVQGPGKLAVLTCSRRLQRVKVRGKVKGLAIEGVYVEARESKLISSSGKTQEGTMIVAVIAVVDLYFYCHTYRHTRVCVCVACM